MIETWFSNLLKTIILNPIIWLLNLIAKGISSLLTLDFGYLFSNKGVAGFVALFVVFMSIVMIILYGIGVAQLRNPDKALSKDITRQALTKRLLLAIGGIVVMPFTILILMMIGVLIKGFSSLLGFKSLSFISILYTFSKVNNVSGLQQFFQNNHITVNGSISEGMHVLVNPFGTGAQVFGQGAQRYLEINQDAVNALSTSSNSGLDYLSYDYIIIIIFVSVAMIFVLLPLIVSIIARFFTMIINYILLFLTLAVNILRPGVYQNQIMKIIADIVILSTYSLIFYLVTIIQNAIIGAMLTSNVSTNNYNEIVAGLVGVIYFTGATTASMWPTWLAQTIFKDDQLISQISSTNRNLWSRSSNAFRTAGLVITTTAGSFSHLFRQNGVKK